MPAKGLSQNFLVLSYVSEDDSTRVRSPKGLLMKFSGTFDLLEDAKEHAERVRNENTLFDVLVVDLYRWGCVPLPDEERAFVSREYTDPLLTRAIAGIQQRMIQGKEEMQMRKEHDREKALARMRKERGPDYVMPEKSKDSPISRTRSSASTTSRRRSPRSSTSRASCSSR